MPHPATLDSQWRIDDGTTVTPIDFHVENEPTVTPATSYTLELVVTAESDSPAGAWPGHFERYQTLLARGAIAGGYDLRQSQTGTVTFTETHGTNGSVLFALRPPADSFGHGGYYLCESVTDQTTLKRLPMLAYESVFVAPLSRFATTDDCRRERGFAPI